MGACLVNKEEHMHTQHSHAHWLGLSFVWMMYVSIEHTDASIDIAMIYLCHIQL